MKREDVKYFANCLKHNYTIDFNTMERFCNEVIESQNKLQKIEAITKSAGNIGFTATKAYFFEEIVEVMNNDK